MAHGQAVVPAHERVGVATAPTVKLPALHHRPPADPADRLLFHDLAAVLAGDVRFDGQSRALYATDASNFRHVPRGVVFPRHAEDVEAALEVCRRHGAVVGSRGGGTGLAGACLTRGILFDHSRYFDRVCEIDPDGRRASVDPGLILDSLRDRAAPHGLTFGPDPSTHNRCTLGGMIGNNSCGVHAIMAEFYGDGPRTADNIESLDVVTYRGDRFRVGATSESEYRQILAAGGARADIYRRMFELALEYGDDLRRELPDIPRRVSGYNLTALLPENGFDVAAALCGSEGTLATVVGARVKLIPHLAERVLLIVGYPDIFAAGDAVPRIREHRPIGLEAVDEQLTRDIEKQEIHSEYLRLLPDGCGWLLIEFGADTAEEAEDLAQRCKRDLERSDGAHTALRLVTDRVDRERLWTIRESGLGATAFPSDHYPSWPGWEDSAVPVDRVGDYLRQLRALYERWGYTGAIYGHFGQGCIHSRIDFDFGDRKGIEDYKSFTREAAELVVSFGGSLSGEHGDGQQRSDLLPVMYSERVLRAFRDFKAIWDPGGCMNPGRIVDAYPRDADLRIQIAADRNPPDTVLSYPEDGDDFYHTAMRCVGVGECRREGGGTMCPSYMVTREEAHSTRGRARLLFEMVRGEVIEDGWASEEVKEALDLCLACKGCKSECPVSVDVADYKAEFLSHYHQKKRRPRQAIALGWIHRWVRMASRLPRLANFVSQTPGLSRVAKAVAGLAPQRALPRFAPHTFRSQFESRGTTEAPSNPAETRRVVLWIDTFNNYFYPDVLDAAASVLMQAGFTVELPRQKLCCGRALYDYGYLDTARSLWQQTLDVLAPAIDDGVPVVGIEPSCVAAFRDELLRLFPDSEPASALAKNTYTLEEFLVEVDYRPETVAGRVILHNHCHDKSVMGAGANREILERLGLDVVCPTTGCCGMAGSFGYEKGTKYEISVAAFQQALEPAISDAGDETLIVSSGFSCREQIRQQSGRVALHVAEVLHAASCRSHAFPLDARDLQGKSPEGGGGSPDRIAARSWAAVGGALLALSGIALAIALGAI